jgi:dihydrofolate reductase
MASLVYSPTASLDGYVADSDGKWGWSRPDDEVHPFINDQFRRFGTYLLGRRMYEVLAYWEAPPALDEQPSYVREFAEIWQAADKIVYSRTLETVSTKRTRIERQFDPEAIRELKVASERDITIAGPELAAQAIDAGLVDEYQLFLAPAIVGGGKHFFPGGGRVDLELVEERRFHNGTVFLRYRTTS